MRSALVVVMLLVPATTFARGFSTVLPLTVSPSAQGSISAANAGRYVDAPVANVARYVYAAPKRTTAGKITDMMRRFLSVGGGGPITHEPATGTPIGQFGEAYTYASPVGRGMSSQEQTVGRQ